MEYDKPSYGSTISTAKEGGVRDALSRIGETLQRAHGGVGQIEDAVRGLGPAPTAPGGAAAYGPSIADRCAELEKLACALADRIMSLTVAL